MKDLVIMHVQAVDLLGVTPDEKLEIEQRYLDAVTQHVDGNISEIERRQSNAMRCLRKVKMYPSGNPAIDSIISKWEETNMVGIEAAFKNLRNTGGAHFLVEFWSR